MVETLTEVARQTGWDIDAFVALAGEALRPVALNFQVLAGTQRLVDVLVEAE